MFKATNPSSIRTFSALIMLSFLCMIDLPTLARCHHSRDKHGDSSKKHRKSMEPYYRTDEPYDLTIAGFFRFSDGLGRIPISIIDCLKDYVSINCISTRPELDIYLGDLSPEVQEIITNSKRTSGKVTIFTDTLWDILRDHTTVLPQESLIKIAYSMIESTALPPQWVTILNTKFDAVVLPDISLIDIYQRSGVKVPLFVLPPPLYLDEFLELPPTTHTYGPFVFGNSSGSLIHKNQLLLIEAFFQAFGNSPDVKLIMNARGGDSAISSSIEKKIQELQATNIEFSVKNLSWPNYIEFMTRLHCYVSFSKGEGFSIAPREALALGTPVIIADNSAHSTVCASGLVKCVPSPIAEEAYYPTLDQVCGNFFNTDLRDAVAALQDVYLNYKKYLKKAATGRLWTYRYHPEHLKIRYLSLVQPYKIYLENQNFVGEDFLITNSISLYKKYLKLGARPAYNSAKTRSM
jgi:hypothetical protein